jgi:protein gp37
MTKTSIEWTQHVWNPFAGCSILSPGCTNCYAMKQARRIEACNAGLRPGHSGAPHYAGTTKIVNGNPVWTGKIGMALDEVLTKPLRRKTPTTYFVNSMSDLFHENVPDEAIDKVFAIMALTPQHTYQVLTKRSARMREYIADCRVVLGRQHEIRSAIVEIAGGRDMPGVTEAWLRVSGGPNEWNPLPNVWLGVSTERQKEYDLRAPDLRETPAAVKFFSMEPLLGPIIAPWLGDLCIVGGENGTRPMHPDWARSLRDQCAAAGVPFFFKQWGTWTAVYDRDLEDPDWRKCDVIVNETPKGQWLNLAGGQGFHGDRVVRVVPIGKKAAGRLLDGVTHDAMPEAAR